MIYLICTPIGNLNDISLRSIEILNSSDLIYAEDTRKAKKIFDRYKIDKKSFSFNDHNERSKTKNIIQVFQSYMISYENKKKFNCSCLAEKRFTINGP